MEGGGEPKNDVQMIHKQSRSDNYSGVIPSFSEEWRSLYLGRDVLFIIITLKLTTDQVISAIAHRTNAYN